MSAYKNKICFIQRVGHIELIKKNQVMNVFHHVLQTFLTHISPCHLKHNGSVTNVLLCYLQKFGLDGSSIKVQWLGFLVKGKT